MFHLCGYMDQTHLHLVITHLPVFGSILGAFVLLYGMWQKSDQTVMAAYYLFVLSAIGAVIAYLTGEAAEETVEQLQGIAETAIEGHEHFAVNALAGLIVLGAVSTGGIIFTLKRQAVSKAYASIVLLISLVAFGLTARTAYLGGQIRHIEIAGSAGQQGNGTAGDAEQDDGDD